jgi:nicotinamidase-related amidase
LRLCQAHEAIPVSKWRWLVGRYRQSIKKIKPVQARKARTVLLIIDWQQFFADPGSPAFIPDTVNVRPRLEALLNLFQKARLPVLASIHSNRDDDDNNFLKFYGKVIKRKSKWWALASPLNCLKNLKIFEKETYSAFENPRLCRFLKALKIKRIVLAGVQTDRCVLASALSGFDRGFEMVVAADVCSSRSKFRHRMALNLIKTSCAMVLKADEIERLLWSQTPDEKE